jgi:hypothetical protein
MLLAIAIFSTLSALAGVYSPGFLEADGCFHYEYAKYALHEHHLLTDVWGRPFCTAIYCLPANIGGLIGVRLTSLAIALAIGLITWRIAAGQGYRWPALGLLFLLGQPMVFLHSFSELTELPFALLLALAFWAYQKRAWFWMTAVAAFLPTARPEGFGFLLMAATALVLHRRFRYLPLLALPLIGWSSFGWYSHTHTGPWYTQIPRWLPENWPYSSASVYDKGSILHFVALMPAIVSPVAFAALLLGVWRSMASGRRTRGLIDTCRQALLGDDHRRRVQWLIAIIPLGILAGHSLLYWTGRMASSGEPRYMLVAAPMWALLAAKGWEWMFIRLSWRRPMAWAGAGLLLPILANMSYPVVPLTMDRDWLRGREAVQWIADDVRCREYPFIIGPHPAVKYYQGVSPTDPAITPPWNHETAHNPPHGAILIWDPIYANYNADTRRIVRLEDIEAAGWVRVHTFPKAYDDHKPGRTTMLMYRLRRPIWRFFGRDLPSPADKPPELVMNEWYIFLSPTDRSGRPTGAR